jgi:hypothetical protein
MIRRWFKYRLPMYWKAVFAWSVPIFLAVQQWYGDGDKSHYSQSDWVKLAFAVFAAVSVQVKANKPYVPPTP